MTGNAFSPRRASWECCNWASRAASRCCGRTSRSSQPTPGPKGSTRPWLPPGWASPAPAPSGSRRGGLEHIQISIQDSDPEVAERIAGVRSVKHKEAAAAIVRELGFAFTVNVVLHRANLDRIGSIIELAADLGANRVELANTQYYGWDWKIVLR